MHEPAELIDAWLDGTLDAEQARALRQWLDQSDEHVRQFVRASLEHYLLRECIIGREHLAYSAAQQRDPDDSAILEQALAHVQLPAESPVDEAEPQLNDAPASHLVRRPLEEADPLPAEPEPRVQKVLEIGPVRVTRRPGAGRSSRLKLRHVRMLAWAAMVAVLVSMAAVLMQELPRQASEPTVVGRVSDTAGASWAVRDADGVVAEAGVGDELLAGGTLEVEKGFVELQMASETRVLVEGPSEIELQREALVRMEQGRLVARTNGAGETFTVVTPSASITDLGTEFGVNVQKDGRTQSTVFEGVARFIGLGDSLNTVQVNAGQTGSAMRGEQPVVRASDARDAHAFVRAMPANDYEALVIQSKPVAYWRFDAMEDGYVRNVMSDAYHAEVVGRVRSERQAGSSVAALGDGSGYLRITEPLSELEGAEEYTFAFWFNAGTYQMDYISLVRLFAGDANDRTALTIGLLGDGGVRSLPIRRMRFTHRNPPGRSGGTQVFNDQSYQLDRWYHIAAVKTTDSSKLYINGELVNTEADDTSLAGHLGKLTIGRDSSNPDQVLKGMLAEVAVYDRALSGEEIVRQADTLWENVEGRL